MLRFTASESLWITTIVCIVELKNVKTGAKVLVQKVQKLIRNCDNE